MSLQTATKHLEKYNLQDKIQVLNTSTSTVELAAQALNTKPERIAKTMAFELKDRNILILFAGNIKTDNTKFKETFNTKAKMINPNELEEKIGHQMGGVCPFGIKEGVEVYLDESLKKHESVFPACGTPNSAIELTIKELETASNYKKWINVGK